MRGPLMGCCLLGLVIGGACAARAGGFDSPQGYSLDLPDGWEHVEGSVFQRLSTDMASTGVTPQGAWHDSSGAVLVAFWWRGVRVASSVAALVDEATDRRGFPARFEREMRSTFPLRQVEVRRSDPRRRLVNLSGLATQGAEELRVYLTAQAARDGAIILCLYVPPADESLYTATFDGLARSLQLAPGHEYRPGPPLALIGAGLGGACVGLLVILARRRPAR